MVGIRGWDVVSDNGAAGNGSAKQNGNKPRPQWFKPGQSGNPSGRPKGTISVARMLREILEEDGEEIFKARARQILQSSERDSDAVKVMELFRKAIDGDKISVAEVDSHEWDTSAEEPNPVPPALETNRLPQRSGG